MNKTLFLLVLLFSSLPVRAATPDPLHPPHGGQIRMAGNHYLELVVAGASTVARQNPVTVYLSDLRGQKLPAAGTQARVILLDGKQKVEIFLSPGGGNTLVGQGVYASLPALKAIVVITFPDGRSERARFTPLLPTAASPLDPDAHSGHRH